MEELINSISNHQSLFSCDEQDLKIDECGLYEAVAINSEVKPKYTALRFMGRSISYSQLIHKIDNCADALISCGVKQGDYVTIASPNCPSAVYMIYAVNKIGAICNMIHPLSAENEIKHFVNFVNSTTLVILDSFLHKFIAVADQTYVKRVITIDISNDLGFCQKLAYKYKTKKFNQKNLESVLILSWKTFINMSKSINITKPHDFPSVDKDDVAAVLYSGGTTSSPKGIALKNYSFSALKSSVYVLDERFKEYGVKLMCIMPIFHGFGLGICLHSALAVGGTAVLVPRFSPRAFEETLVKEKCNYIAGVPALFEEWMNMDNIKKHDYSFLYGVFCGGDKLAEEQKNRIDSFLKKHNTDVTVQEGYGLSETLTCCCLMPNKDKNKLSIGLPLPGTKMKIVDKDSLEEKPIGNEGEIVVSGPLMMKHYIKNDIETKRVLKKHDDGLLWLHTGDIGYQDVHGYFYFVGRYKRVIVSSGYTVYPNILESVLDEHNMIFRSCVIGVDDARRGKRLKAIIELNHDVDNNKDIRQSIIDHCKKNLGKHLLPHEYEFVNDLPTTKVGKIDYRYLENKYS